MHAEPKYVVNAAVIGSPSVPVLRQTTFPPACGLQ